MMGPKYPKPYDPSEPAPEPDMDPPESGRESRTQARDAFDPDWKHDEDKCY